MAQDKNGFLWLAKADGLFRFDGRSTKAYRPVPFDTTTISHSYVERLHLDKEGILWVATLGGGLNRIDPSTGVATHFRYRPDDPTSLSSDRTISVLRDREGMLWVGTMDSGLNRLDPATGWVRRYRHAPDDTTSLSHDRVIDIHEDQTGRIWIGTNNGLSLYEPDSDSFARYFFQESVPPPDWAWSENSFTGFANDAQNANVLWISSSHGLIRFDVGAMTHSVHVPGPGGSSLMNEVLRDPLDTRVFWIAAVGDGLYRFDSRTGTFSHYMEGFSLIGSLFADRSGMIWAGSFRFHPETSRLFRNIRQNPDDPSQLGGLLIYALYEDRDGAVWAGHGWTGRGLLSRIDRRSGEITRYGHDPSDPQSLGEGQVMTVEEDEHGSLWVSTSESLNRMDPASPGVFTRYEHDPTDPTSLRGGIITELYADQAGTLWIGTRGGLDRMNVDRPGRFEHVCTDVSNPQCLGKGWVDSIMEDHAGSLWVSTSEGIHMLDRESNEFTHYVHDPRDPTSLPATGKLLERAQEPGVIWIASTVGLIRLDTRSEQFTRVGQKDGLTENYLYSIVEDDAGDIWLSMRDGLSRFDPESQTFRHFDRDDGLLHGDYNDNAALKTRSGELFFGGVNGIDYFNPADLRINTVPPAIAFTDLRIDNQSVEVGTDSPLKVPLVDAKEIRLPPGYKSLTFEFAALHYQSPERNQYAYKLDGYDDAWIEASTRRTATYTSLEPGGYTFRVKASNSDGVWDDEGIALRLAVLPPWWRTTSAYAAYILLLLAGIGIVDRARRRQVIERERRRAEIREAELRAQTLEAENRQKEAELERKRQVEAANEKLRAHERQLEEQNDRLEAQYVQLEEQAHRLAEMDELKSRFFANISHEFRTPLTLILGPVRDFLQGHIDAERFAEHTPVLHRNGQRLLRLINQLLDLSKLEAGRLRLDASPVDLVSYLQLLVRAFSSRAESADLKLSFSTDMEKLETSVDDDKLEKVVTNLLSNAFKFTPAGGKISVSFRAVDGSAIITVKDTGEGIPADELPHVFDRFYQVDSTSTRRHEGTGIGLALSKELVELHGGTIEVESERGFGSTFTVTLPIREAQDESVKTQPTHDVDIGIADNEIALEARPSLDTNGAPSENAATILVVEDNPDMRAYLRSHLQTAYHIIEAEDGADGLDKAKEHRPDLVISDVMMPEMDGFALCEAIRAEDAIADVPVVLLTAKADEASRIEGLETGADDYLAKPFSVEELGTRVENLIEIRRRLRQRFSREVRLGPGEISVTSEDAAFVERVREVIESEMGESTFGVDRLAEEIGLSRRQLHRRIKEVTDLTPGGYIRMMRLERAAQLLEQDAGLVSEIAYTVGFNDANYFSRLFRQTFRCPPSEYLHT